MNAHRGFTIHKHVIYNVKGYTIIISTTRLVSQNFIMKADVGLLYSTVIYSPVLWNGFAGQVKNSESVSIFEKQLKTSLFRLEFS